ncbi:MAG: hypothetical protein N2Z22_08215 [Turneriella sp.]|nr:hypothetical protein [Turneriella sp.]
MRRSALLTLLCLGTLQAAPFSALHIDAGQSHGVVCAPAMPAADCHADLPHQHQATHAGEESLFEYIFSQSREAKLLFGTLLLAALFCQKPWSPEPVTFHDQNLPDCDETGLLNPATSNCHSRAPPFSP